METDRVSFSLANENIREFRTLPKMTPRNEKMYEHFADRRIGIATCKL